MLYMNYQYGWGVRTSFNPPDIDQFCNLAENDILNLAGCNIMVASVVLMFPESSVLLCLGCFFKTAIKDILQNRNKGGRRMCHFLKPKVKRA